MENFVRGSEWRKWDLHLHTPSSYDYKNSSVTNEEIVDNLKNNNIKVVVIADHHIIDVERYLKLVELGNNEVEFLPGIELRTDLCLSTPIHIVAIFKESNDERALKQLWDTIKIKLGISELTIESKGQDKISVCFKDAVAAIKELGGLISIHAGSKSATIENIENGLPYKEAIKEEIASVVDFYEIGKLKDIDDYIKHVFPDIKKFIPMVRGSDNHNIKEYELKFNCWIKGDPNFEGLKQARTRSLSSRVSLAFLPTVNYHMV